MSNLSNVISIKFFIKYKCKVCNIVKTKKNRNHELLKRVKQLLNLVFIDIYNLFSTLKYRNKKYFIKVINNYIRYSIVFIEKTRKECTK